MVKKRDVNKVIILSAGGTGGHIFPAQAIAEKLQKENCKLHMICDKKAMKYFAGVFCDIDKTIIFTSRRRENFNNTILNITLLLMSLIKIIWKFCFDRPKAVISFGGYPTISSSLYSIIFHTPLVLHEQNSILGRVNRFFYHLQINYY